MKNLLYAEVRSIGAATVWVYFSVDQLESFLTFGKFCLFLYCVETCWREAKRQFIGQQ